MRPLESPPGDDELLCFTFSSDDGDDVNEDEDEERTDEEDEEAYMPAAVLSSFEEAVAVDGDSWRAACFMS